MWFRSMFNHHDYPVSANLAMHPAFIQFLRIDWIIRNFMKLCFSNDNLLWWNFSLLNLSSTTFIFPTAMKWSSREHNNWLGKRYNIVNGNRIKNNVLDKENNFQLRWNATLLLFHLFLSFISMKHEYWTYSMSN